MKRNHWLLAFAVLLVCTLLNAASSPAQNTATLSGVVKDQSSGSVKGAKVTLISKSTGAERSAISDDEGRYSFVSLAPASYKVRVEGPAGFEVLEEDDLEITVGAQASLNPVLKVRGNVSTALVTARLEIIERDQSEVSNTIGGQ